MQEHFFILEPVAKPRMTRRDKWLSPPRPCVARYRAFSQHLSLLANSQGLDLTKHGAVTCIFGIATKTKTLWNTPHQPRGGKDADNLLKAVLDVLCPKERGGDSHLWDIRAVKYWAERGYIKILV